MATTVHVKNIAPQTTEKEVRDFFSFCGKISLLTLTPAGDTQNAAVSFEKPTAAKTALLLDSTQLGPNLVHVESGDVPEGASEPVTTGQRGSEEIEQDDKPHTRIIAEYLAHGYHIGDQAIERAIALDNQHGFSTRFTTALQNFDTKYRATDRAKELDAKYQVSGVATNAWAGFNTYFEKAVNTPTGQKLRDFYIQGNKQVMDVHREARRLADLKAGKTPEGDVPLSEKMGMEQIPGTEKTKCTCAGASGVCPCEPGKCACVGCEKNTDTPAKS